MIDLGADQDVVLVERYDLSAISGIYVTEDPEDHGGIRMWCGYCRRMLHFDSQHMGVSPFLTLMVKMADAHRLTDCPHPQGPFAHDWSPRHSRDWEQLSKKGQARREAAEKQMRQIEADNLTHANLPVDWSRV